MEGLLSIQAYSYHPVSGEYLGTATAWENPIDRGTYLLPAHSTDVEPPAFQDGKIRVWDGDSWVYQDAPPASPGDAPITPEQLAEAVRQQRDLLLRATDYTQHFDVPINGTLRAAFATYRQQLRDLPSQPGFPETMNWPVAPQYNKT